MLSPASAQRIQAADDRAEQTRERALAQGLARFPQPIFGMRFSLYKDGIDRYDWEPGEMTRAEIWGWFRHQPVIK